MHRTRGTNQIVTQATDEMMTVARAEKMKAETYEYVVILLNKRGLSCSV